MAEILVIFVLLFVLLVLIAGDLLLIYYLVLSRHEKNINSNEEDSNG